LEVNGVVAYSLVRVGGAGMRFAFLSSCRKRAAADVTRSSGKDVRFHAELHRRQSAFQEG